MISLSSFVIHDQRDNLARQTCELSRLARLESNAQALANLVRDEFLEVVASTIRRSRTFLLFVDEKSNANPAREEFPIDDYAY